MATSSANLETITNKDLIWINIENPTRQSMEEVARHGYHFHELNIEDCLSKRQIPKIDRHKENIFILLHFPTSIKPDHPSHSQSHSNSNLHLHPNLSSTIPTLMARARRRKKWQQFFNYHALRTAIDVCGKEFFSNCTSRASSTAQ